MICNSEMELQISDRQCKNPLPSQIQGKETGFPGFVDYHHHQNILAPLEKLISSEKLAFLPNLYFQQYRLLDMLSYQRVDYPDQKILVPKEPARHDFLIKEMRTNHFILEEEIKYRKAACFNLAKSAKQEYFKKKLKKEEKYLFHRVAFSQLAEAVKSKFQSHRPEEKGPEKKEEVPENKKIIKPKIYDDIFLDKDESDIDMLAGDEDLIGDLFGNNPGPENHVEKEAPPVIFTIEDYIGKVLSAENRIQECQKMINRKACLRKINENIRKRIKSKLNEDSGQKNLNSATVLITSLISSETEAKNGEMTNESNLIDPPAETQFLNSGEPRQKKKRQENFELKWNREELENYSNRNSKFDIAKSKFDSNYLTMNIVKDQREYERVFSKNIGSKEPFPPSISSIPNIQSKFSIPNFLNTPADKEYQQAIIKHNKRSKYEKFKKISEFALVKSDYHSMDSEDYNNTNSSNNISKIFLNPDLTVSDRVIYQISSNKIIPVNVIHNKSNLTKQEILLLNFLVRRYLSVFGSNWDIITSLILTHPNFSSMELTTQQIQEIYQIPREKDMSNGINTSVEQINVLNKKILPSSVFMNCSYEVMRPDINMSAMKMDEAETDQSLMKDENEQHSQSQPLNLLNYESIIEEELEEHENPSDYIFHKTAKMYDEFTNNMKLPDLREPYDGLADTIGKVIAEFEGKSQTKFLENKEVTKFNQCSDWVLDKVKNQIKFNTPIRKRKNITDKSSELVKILHTLKQRIQNPTKTVQPIAARLPPSEMTRELAKPPIASATVNPPPPTPPQSQQIKKTLPKAKPEDKKQKTGQKEQKDQKDQKDQKQQKQPKEPKEPKQQKERKKKPGKDEKDAEKDLESK